MAGLPPPPPPPGRWQSPWPPSTPVAPPYHPPAYGYPQYGQTPPPGWVYVAPTYASRFGRTPATFGERLGAYLLDGLIVSALSIPVWVLGLVFVATGWETQRGTCTDIEGVAYECTELTNGAAVRLILALGLCWLLTLVVSVFYWGHFEGRRGATPGKRVLGLEVIRQTNGARLGFGLAVGRYAAKSISGFLLLGYLWMLWDDNKQTWHDKIVSSIVVKTEQ